MSWSNIPIGISPPLSSEYSLNLWTPISPTDRIENHPPRYKSRHLIVVCVGIYFSLDYTWRNQCSPFSLPLHQSFHNCHFNESPKLNCQCFVLSEFVELSFQPCLRLLGPILAPCKLTLFYETCVPFLGTSCFMPMPYPMYAKSCGLIFVLFSSTPPHTL